MDAISEIRSNLINILRSPIECSEILQWAFYPQHSFSVQILYQTSSYSEDSLILCQNLIEREHHFLNQGISLFSCAEGNVFPLNKNQDIENINQYPFLLIPCYYQSVYSGGFLVTYPNSSWEKSEILLIQKLVDQYACVQHWINKNPNCSIASSYQAYPAIVEILTEALSYHLDPEKALEKILVLISEYFNLEEVEIKLQTDLECKIIQKYHKNKPIKINSLLKISILKNTEINADLILKTSHINQVFPPLEMQSLEKISQYISVLLQQLQLNKKLQDVITKNDLLENSNQNKSEFLAHINHELRTPLTGILGFSRMLNEEIYGPLNDKQKQYMQGISTSGEHLLSLINDFLDISKIEANREELFLEKLAVEDVCLSALSMLQARAKEQKLELKLEVGSNVNMFTADQRRLKQILLNLLSNAIKFTEEGSVTLKVESFPEQLVFCVIDTGIGIKSSDQTQLFQPFQQIHNHLSRKQKGTGLGLALSRKLAQLHGGDITLTSEVGKGSCFTLNLPFQSEL